MRSMQNNLRKVIQKQVYDILSHRYGLITVFIALVVLIVAAFHFGEVMNKSSPGKRIDLCSAGDICM